MTALERLAAAPSGAVGPLEEAVVLAMREHLRGHGQVFATAWVTAAVEDAIVARTLEALRREVGTDMAAVEDAVMEGLRELLAEENRRRSRRLARRRR